MAGGDTTQQSIRKVLGALKDSTTVGLAKVNSDYKELDVAIVKATNHVEQLAKEKHLRTIFDAVSASRPRADVAYCINVLARRLAKTHNWAMKLLMERLFLTRAEVGRELYPFDLAFLIAWDYSAWVRTYALYLEERLECFRVLKYDVETERSQTSELDTIDLLEHLPALQQLLFRLLACQPEGAAIYNVVIKHALSMVAGESIKIYRAINGGTLNLVDKFFEMQRHDALRALEIYRKAGHQAERLSEFYEICKGLDLGRGANFVKIEQPPGSFIVAMEEYVKDASRASALNRNVVDTGRSATAESVLAIEHKKVNDDDEKPEPAPLPPESSTSESTQTPVGAPSVVPDLLGLDDFSQGVTQLEEKNALALAIVNDNPLSSSKMPDVTSESTGWELALVGAPSSNDNAVAESKLAGGLDKLTLDSLYDDAISRRTNQSGGYHMGQVAPNPFEVAAYPQDPFHASNNVAPPANVQMAAIAQQQTFMMQQQQQTMAQGGANPFGNPYGAPGIQSYPTHNPYTGFM